MSLPDDFNYTKDIENPALQQFYSILQGIALNESETEYHLETDDNMRPPPSMMTPAVLKLGQDIKAMGNLSDAAIEAAGSKVSQRRMFSRCFVFVIEKWLN